ncbi:MULTISPECIES: ABC transporter permease [Mesorhizobium]|uniref:ABC transporter permease n=1 Tax=Mesorhizobium denitrificans TaxID=2294114 RepID=A0A371XBM9_9HYPH|nr:MULTISPECIES: ABC transporter permease [Mesorhizobium]RFC66601.1 ABC transporter permease [Mesorhizobium denitrificans]
MSQSRGSQNTYLLVPILLIALLLGTAVIRGPNLVSMAGFGSAIIVAAPLIFATFSLMSLAVAGRGTVDLAVGPLLAFINVSLVRLNGLEVVTGPFGVFFVAIGIGVLYQLLFALIIIFVRVQPIIVALSGFLALTGINLVILPRPGGSAPEWMLSWGVGTTIFSPVLLLLLLAIGGWLLFTVTSFYSNLRLMGYDERAAYTSGVRINLVRVGAHIIAGIFVGLGAICYTALIASGDPTQGTTMTLTAVTALVLGGVSLSGGRGGVTGALLGAVNLFLIGYVLATFNFGATQAFVTQLFYGLILVLSLLLTLLVPVIGRYLYFISPFAAFIVLGAIVVGIMLQVSTYDAYVLADAAAGAAKPAATGAAGYFLLPIADGGVLGFVDLSPIQRMAMIGVAALAVLVFTARMIVAEAAAVRFGAFMYVFIGGLILLLFFVVGEQTHADSVSPPQQSSGVSP